MAKKKFDPAEKVIEILLAIIGEVVGIAWKLLCKEVKKQHRKA